MSQQAPAIGTTVHYRLSTYDVGVIDKEIPQRDGDGRYLRNPVSAGSLYPAQVVAAWGGTTCNLVVQLDGGSRYWATSRQCGDGDGLWSWPDRGAPALGDVVLYRGRQGVLAPRCAVVTATTESLDPGNVAAGAVPGLADEQHVHLWVFTPGASGGFAEFDVPRADVDVPGRAALDVGEIAPGSWCWPPQR